MSESINELFEGVAVIIDDDVDDPNANIKGILNRIREEGLPVITYRDIPPSSTIKHFRNLSFLLLDWNLTKYGHSQSVLKEENDSNNLQFIKALFEICFCPVFIFTNEDESEQINIQKKLVDAKIIVEGRPSPIFIKSKAAFFTLTSTSLFPIYESYKEQLKSVFKNIEIEQIEFNLSTTKKEIEVLFPNEDCAPIRELLINAYRSLFVEIGEWVQTNPSIYVLKEWEREYQKCKNRLFVDFQQMSPVWPQVMWKCFDEDGGNKSLELGELITRNLHTRMKPFEFNEDLLKGTTPQVERCELRKVLEGAIFLKELHEGDISTGDVFLEEFQDAGSAKHRYWLNIRAQCDLLRGGDPCLYCLIGYELIQKSNGKIDNISFSQGEYLEKGNHAIVPFIDDGKIIEFKFGEFEVSQLSALSTDQIRRIGRILPPYITKIQQRFALYLHRQGLPRIPDAAVFQ